MGIEARLIGAARMAQLSSPSPERERGLALFRS
jgi:hypothetical protein